MSSSSRQTRQEPSKAPVARADGHKSTESMTCILGWAAKTVNAPLTRGADDQDLAGGVGELAKCQLLLDRGWCGCSSGAPGHMARG